MTDSKMLTVEEACDLLVAECGATANATTLRKWVNRCKAGDERMRGLPYHQIGKGFPLKFHRDMLIRWWNHKYNVGTGAT